MEQLLTLAKSNRINFKLSLAIILVIFELSQVSKCNRHFCYLECTKSMFLAKLEFTIIDISYVINMYSITMVLVLSKLPRIFLNQPILLTLTGFWPSLYDQLPLSILLIILKHSFKLVYW